MTISEQPFYIQATIKLMLAALVIAFLILAQNILIPFTLAIFFTFLLLPVSQKLEQWRFPKGLAVFVSIILAFAVFGLMLYIFSVQVLSFVNDWPVLQKTMSVKLHDFQNFISTTFNVGIEEQQAWVTTKIQENASQGGVLILGLFSATTSFLASFALIPIYVYFLSVYQDKFKEFVRLIAKEDKNEHAIVVVKEVSKVSQKYILGIFLDVVILSILNSVGFLIIGLPHAILFGVLVSVLNIIPYIGVLIGSALPILMSFLTFDSLGYTIAVVGVCVFVQFLDNNFITPLVVGSSVSINPLTATLALIASSLIWGIPGMVLCMPITGMVKVVCDNIDSLKPYGFLLGEETSMVEKEPPKKKTKRRLFRKKNSQI